MLRILKGERGLAPAILILVIVWALAAVLMLTGTLVAAGQIDDSVAIIKPEVSDIGTDTEAIALAAKTARISLEIRKSAAPLTGELDDTLAAARGIDTTAKSILRKAGTINSTVMDINGNVKTIGTTVGSIGSNVSAIGGTVQAIGRNASSINASARSINASAQSVNSNVKSIDRRATLILSTVKSIDPAVSGINNRAVVIQGVARDLGGDLAQVQKLVGRTNGDSNTIINHANSIDCSNLLNLSGGGAGALTGALGPLLGGVTGTTGTTGTTGVLGPLLGGATGALNPALGSANLLNLVGKTESCNA